MSKCFFKKTTVNDQSTSSTEEISMEEPEAEEQPMLDQHILEGIFRHEVAMWLDINGKALFNLTANQWLAKQKKAERGLKVVRK